LDESAWVIVEGIQKTQQGGLVTPEQTVLTRKDPWGDLEAAPETEAGKIEQEAAAETAGVTAETSQSSE
jgi:hypothetical protein